MELNVINIKGKQTGRKIKLNKDVFEIEPNDHAIYLDVKSHLANKRQGTHKSKQRSEIKGSTRKIKKQKGTGTARPCHQVAGEQARGGAAARAKARPEEEKGGPWRRRCPALPRRTICASLLHGVEAR